MQSSILDRYLSVNPKRANPFNEGTHAFVSCGDPATDARYLAAQRLGFTARFYVGLGGVPHRPSLVVIDKHNGNVAASLSIPLHPNPYAGAKDIAVHAENHARHLADAIGADYWPNVRPSKRLSAYARTTEVAPVAAHCPQAVPA